MSAACSLAFSGSAIEPGVYVGSRLAGLSNHLVHNIKGAALNFIEDGGQIFAQNSEHRQL